MIIDTHCHLYDPAFADVRETLRQALTHDVWGVVAVGCDPESNERTLAAAAVVPKAVWAALGFHPDWTRLTDADLERVEQQLRDHHSRIVALGEVGLPWYSLEGAADPTELMTSGRRRLDRLLTLAVRYDLAVALHAPHGAAVGALEALRRHGIERAVFHWHKAPADVTQAIVDAGYFVSVTPEVVHRDRDREMVAAVPLDALLVESDAPWKYRGEFEGLPSGPWFAGRVGEEIAKIKQLPVEDVMFRLSSNACRLFDLVWI
ncbi:MAG TPA: TatD family hydrolase [Methylomirabilota bacterium]|jgi:TatD DNase family protein|nr:TatD family hydrolase [Methylomirabilota bacterium]